MNLAIVESPIGDNLSYGLPATTKTGERVDFNLKSHEQRVECSTLKSVSSDIVAVKHTAPPRMRPLAPERPKQDHMHTDFSNNHPIHGP